VIGSLPKQLNVNGIDRAIRSDFRTALLIFTAYNDNELLDNEKTMVMLECLYVEFEQVDPGNYLEAIEKGVQFLDGGGKAEKGSNHSKVKKVMDWEQDEQIIFSAINKIAGYETRAKEYLHWWTFLGFFNEIGEGLFTSIINIRSKKNKGKKLEKYEQEFYRDNKNLIDIKVKYTEDEQAEIDEWNKLLG
jgi:hypothetical protein